MSTDEKNEKLKDLPAKKVDADAATQPKGGKETESEQVKGGAGVHFKY